MHQLPKFLDKTLKIARELGIPAIVGCGDATSRLKTGDRIYLDGEKGIIKILDGY